MFHYNKPFLFTLIAIAFLSTMIVPTHKVNAGIFNNSDEVTYKEYWVPHSEFTAGCGTAETAGDSWYIEPWPSPCSKILSFEIPDDFSQALRAEIYIDLWRNHDEQVARFNLNGGPTHMPDVGSDWSRTPYIGDIPLSELQQGTNAITFWNVDGGYHVHDVAIRIYHTPFNPLVAGTDSDVVPPTGILTGVAANGTTFSPFASNTLIVNDDEVTLTATAENAQYVEFHAFYDGYDEDNDGVFKDWHNLGRNNYFPGGLEERTQGGTINHIGTDTTSPYSATWDVSLIPAQADVQFKIRIVDENGNVRESAGGASGLFELLRTNNVTVETYLIPDFEDAVLHHDGVYADEVSYFIDLPADISTVTDAHLVGAYWQNPYISVNGNANALAFSGGQDIWSLSKLQIPITSLLPGQNEIEYIYNPAQINFGQFIEKPGPMIVLRRSDPDFTTSRPSLYFGSDTSNSTLIQKLGVLNIGGGSINWDVTTSGSAPWLDVTPTNGLNEGIIDVSVNTDGLLAGTYTENLLISAQETSKIVTVPITLVVGTSVPAIYDEDFEAYTVGGDADFWTGTGANNSLTTSNGLFEVGTIGGNQLFQSNSSSSNYHAHYQGANSDALSNYQFNGRIMMANAGNRLGVTFLSDYNQSDTYYRLRRYGTSEPNSAFHLTTHGTSITGGTTNTGVVPLANVWYQFKIEVEDQGFETHIRAKVWPESESEPVDWQIEAIDASETRQASGTIGVWSHSFGTNYWDDFNLSPIVPPGPYSLVLNESGNGTVVADPDAVEYANGQSVSLTAVPDPGWVFVEWSGDLSGSQNPAELVMNSNKTITAVFAEDIPQTITTNSIGNGSITLDPDQASYSIGDTVTVTAVADSGWYFNGWSGDLSGTVNPAIITVDGNEQITATFTQELPGLLNDSFNNYTLGADPTDWLDTAANNSMIEDDGLFAVSDANGEQALGTSSTASNIHSHYDGTGSDSFSNYVYSGQMMLTNGTGGIGVTFLSDYNQSDTYYRLRRYGSGGSFRLSPHGTSISSGTTDSGVVPSINVWYEFKIEVEDNGSQTNIRAKIWQAGTTEPVAWQIDAIDSSGSRLTSGTVGVWSYGSGSKYWDDINVSNLEADSYGLTLASSGNGSVVANPDAVEYVEGTVVEITAVPDTGWAFLEWSGDLSGNTNPASLVMNGNKTVTAVFIEDTPQTLTTTVTGNGAITIDPDQATFDVGETVDLTAVPTAGWLFLEWSGDLNGSENPTTIVMDADKTVTAVFIEDIPQTVTTNIIGNGTITLDPDQATYSLGDIVTVTATANAGWYFDSWSGDLSGNTTPQTITIDGNKTVTATFAETPPGLLNENFNGYSVGNNPTDWQDTAANNSMSESDTLFAIVDVNGEPAFGTSSTASNIHSHYQGTGSDSFDNYLYTGKMMLTNSTAGIGVTFLSDYNQSDAYYRLRRYGNGGTFRLSPHGTSITSGLTDSGVEPAVDVWYAFKIEVEDTGTQTNIRAKVWQSGTPEPTEWQIDAIDSSGSRLTSGTVGLWSYGGGSKYWDDIHVSYLAPEQYSLTLNNSGNGTTTAVPDATDYTEGTTVEITAVPDAGWTFLEWSGDLSGSTNPASVVMNANKTITAVFIEDVPQILSTNVTGNGAITVDPDQATYDVGDEVSVTAVPDAGWLFLEWSGDLSGSTNPATVVMNGDKTVTAVFVEDIPQTVTHTVIGNGSITLNPDQPTYSLGDTVTVTAIADAGWYFDGWSGDLSGAINPTSIIIDSSKSFTATFTQELPGLINETFNGYTVGSDPTNWQDTAANNSMTEDDSLFAVADINGNLALGTSSTASNIHSHYQNTNSAAFSNYSYTGQMMLTDATGGIGLTFLSDYNQSDTYYRLRRFGNGGSFRLSPHGTSMSGGTTDSGVVPAVDVWYEFRIEVEDTGTQTDVRVKIWEAGTAEPLNWQIDAFDSSSSRLTSGTVGVWSYGNGSKYWDDIYVTYLSTGPYALTLNSSGNGSVAADPDQVEYFRDDVVTLTAVPDAGWQFDGWSGDLSGNSNPGNITINGDRTITANFSLIPTYSVSTNVTGSGAITLDPNQANYNENSEVTVTAVPDTGWRFAGWEGDIFGLTNPVTLLVNSNKTVTATFVEDVPLSLTVNSVGNGTTLTTPDQATYGYGDSISISAMPSNGWRLDSWQTDPPIANGWWNTQWDYRLPVTINGAGFTRTDAIADVPVDFTSAWASLGVTDQLDLDSLRVIEVSSDGAVLNTAVSFQFDPDANFNASSNASGTMIILLNGNTGPNSNRYFHIYYDATGKGFAPASSTALVTLTDNVMDEGLTTFRIVNNAATYFFDKQGGGFSSIVDSNGNDWINYNSTVGSAGTFRGIPNLVYPEGYMHPGNTNSSSVLLNQGPLKATIQATSNNGNWQTIWEIYPDFARLTVVETNHNYWFLYEGTPGGTLDLGSDIVVRSDGTQTLVSEAWTGDLTGDEWVYFGDPALGRSLYVVNHMQDTAVDSYSQLDGNMTVMGFGRSNVDTFLTAVPAQFTIGLLDDTAYGGVSADIESAYKPLSIVVANAEDQAFIGDADGELFTFNITTNQVVTATFTQLISPTLSVTAMGNGSTIIEPNLAQYTNGQTVTVTAVSDAGNYFVGWSGDQVSTENPLVFNITDDTSLTATFAESTPLTLGVNINGNGSVQIDPDQPTYFTGDVVTVTASADSGWIFSNWSGDIASFDNPVVITMADNTTITANFTANNPEAPTIDVWYGDEQEYGQNGLPQPWFNIHGNVSDADGIGSLVYSLNNQSSVNLSLGPNFRRLANHGDFNVDLNYLDLNSGLNTVVITATDTIGNEAVETVIVDYTDGVVWPSSYTIDWSTVNEIEEVAQVVDGKWEVQEDGLRILEVAYDRLVGIGDVSWTDYEIEVPITIHGIDSNAFGNGVSGRGTAVGFLMRWNGHTDFPISGWQPKVGWLPYGAIGWYWWDSENSAHLRIDGNNGTILDESVSNTPPTFEQEYIFKMRVTTIPDVGGLYQMKVWPSSQAEPAEWMVSGQEELSDPQSGSVLLLAHHVDATFGNVTINPIGSAVATLDVATLGAGSVVVNPDQPEYLYGETVDLTAVPDPGWIFTGWSGDLSGVTNPTSLDLVGSKQVTATFIAETTPPTISNVTVTPFVDTAVVTWNTDKPSSSEVAYGTTSGYELGSINDVTLRTSHAITVTGLMSNTTYHYQITVIDSSENSSSTPDDTFTTEDGTILPGTLISDDFNVCTLNSELWSFVDPIGDSSVAINGTQLLLSVPQGVRHEPLGTNTSARLMQSIDDGDFELEVKFESAISEQYEEQGVIIEQDANDYLRFDFYSNNGTVYIYAARITNGGFTTLSNIVLGAIDAPMTMRINRVGDSWTQSYSLDGSTWTTSASFSHSLVVSQAGVFAGNAGTNPAHTAVIDYFFNTANPIVPEDGDGNSLTVNVVGNGSVSRDPDQTVFACGGDVALTAVPDTGWLFDGWSGDLTGATNPETLTMDSNKTVTATFIEETIEDTTPPVISNVNVTADTDSALITWETNELADSAVDYGETSSYELGNITDGTLTTNHAITVTGLLSDTTYHYQITSIDASDNSSSTTDATFITDDGIVEPDTTPPVISNVQVTVDVDSATITWDTDEPAESAVSYGETTGYELGDLSSTVLQTSHSIMVTGLMSDTTYHYQITSIDASDNSSSTSDATFTTDEELPPTPAVVSDDFNVCAVDSNLWSFIDPIGDSSMAINGSQLLLSVPQGGRHEPLGTNTSARLMQATADEDFEIEVKFESNVSEQYEEQGILIEQDADDYLRFDFYGNNGTVFIYAARITAGGFSTLSNVSLGVIEEPMYMRITRAGDSWTQAYSLDGSSWTTSASFTHALSVSQSGVFVGNAGTNPAHTAVIDYFFNTANPIVPEDGNGNSLMVNTVGNGSVNLDVDQPLYVCGETVELTAVPDTGWLFDGWSGDLTGATNPQMLTMDSNKTVTATFIEEIIEDSTPPVISNINVTADTDSALITWSTDEPADSAVAYGETSGYELGSETNGSLSMSHAITVTGLLSDTTYHYQITSVDASDNSSSTTDAMFTTDDGIVEPDITPPVISNVQVTVDVNSATITWDTDEPADSAVAYGETNGYELGSVTDGTLQTAHTITLTGLMATTVYHFQILSADGSANSSSTVDDTFTTDAEPIPTPTSDDFNVCALDTDLWRFVDPIGDGSMAMSGTQLLLSVPAGGNHEPLGTNTAVRLMQDMDDEDFEIEVKFESDVSDQFQMQGIIIEQDANDYLRFDFYGNNGTVYIFAARVTNGGFTTLSNVVLGAVDDPMYMRIGRVGDNWTQSYSLNGSSWTTSASFTHALAVSEAGVFAGNAGGQPAHTAVIDYFFNTAVSITPEDPNPSLTCE